MEQQQHYSIPAVVPGSVAVEIHFQIAMRIFEPVVAPRSSSTIVSTSTFIDGAIASIQTGCCAASACESLSIRLSRVGFYIASYCPVVLFASLLTLKLEWTTDGILHVYHGHLELCLDC